MILEEQMAFLLPECDHAEEKLGGHLMGRVLRSEFTRKCVFAS